MNARVVGRYRLGDELGTGEQFTVYRADDDETGRQVAVKIADAGAAAEAIHAVEQEGALLARVRSPHVAPLVARGEEAGRPFLVIGTDDATSLRDRLDEDGPFGVSDAVVLAIQLADGLRAIHEQRIVHRDVRPANVLLGHDGHARLADLGAPPHGESPDDYRAPEIAAGDAPDPRADVYSLGLVLLELLTGDAPTARGDARRSTRRALRTRVDGVPRSLDAVVTACLAVDPAERPQSAGQVASMLRDVLADLTGEAPRPALDRRPPAEALPWDDAAPLDDVRDVLYPSQPTVGALAAGDRNAGPLRWLAVFALIGAVGALAWAWRTSFGGGQDATSVAAASPEPSASTTTATAPATSTTTGTAGLKPLEVMSVATFDPGGDARENDEELPLVVDGNPATTWSSESYQTPDLSFKGGVGFVLDLRGARRVRALELTTPAPGFSLSVYATIEDTAPVAIEGWGEPAAEEDVLTSTKRIALDQTPRARYLLIWFTQLAPAPGESSFRATIAEATPLT